MAAAIAAIAKAAAPVIGGLGCDYAAVAACLALARKCGAVVDHAGSGAMLRDLDPMRSAGLITITAPEAHAVADTALLIGEHAGAPAKVKRIVHLCRGDGTLGGPASEAAVKLGVLRAVLAGRRVSVDDHATYAEAASLLSAAKYGVVCWSARELEALAVEQACGLVNDLNQTTRFAALPEAAADNGGGVVAAAAAVCGFPTRISFASGEAKHDPWRYDAKRMIASGEADLLLWVAAMRGSALPDPAWGSTLRLIAIAPQPVPGAEITLICGIPGVTHNAVLFDPSAGQLVARAASAPSPAPTASSILHSLAESL